VSGVVAVTVITTAKVNVGAAFMRRGEAGKKDVEAVPE